MLSSHVLMYRDHSSDHRCQACREDLRCALLTGADTEADSGDIILAAGDLDMWTIACLRG